MKRYTEYRYSGAEWIGEVPVSWGTCRLKAHLRRNEPRNPGDQQVLSLYREFGIIPKDSRDDNHNVTSEDTSNYKYVRPGDFVINKMKAWQGSVAVSDYEGVVSPAYYIYHFTDDVYERRYFHYLLRSCYKEEFMRLSAGIRIGQWDLSSEDLDNVTILVPSKDEQVAIAAYLDKATDSIDTLIKEAKASIDEYKAWKASIIYEAVTKGLDKDAEMKDSGVEQIGSIPFTWDCVQIARVLEKSRAGIMVGPFGSSLTNAVVGPEEGKYKIYGQANLIRKDFSYGDKYITEFKYHELSNYVVVPGDIAVSMMGTIGKCKVIPNDIEEGIMDSHLIKLRLGERMNPYFFEYAYESIAVFEQIMTRSKGSIMTGLNSSIVKSLYIPVPELEEQISIVIYLDKICQFIDSLISEKELLISDLEAYKKSLIFEVVTGKRKVV